MAGYKAVLLGASMMPRFLPMMTTAAGSITPAKAFVIGAGVAGLQAIATARRLGAVVSAFDVPSGRRAGAIARRDLREVRRRLRRRRGQGRLRQGAEQDEAARTLADHRPPHRLDQDLVDHHGADPGRARRG
ncbi:MAG: hypothetical protein U5K74_11185 [Gemmatimonadaceae bacterium]|nr:hypothetical protein [Gemmatimonadaceae bacterium]